MSDLNQIHTALERLFHTEGRRIVFWNDPDREFLNTLPFVTLDGVTKLRLDEVGALRAKIRVERDEPESKFLLYSPNRRAFVIISDAFRYEAAQELAAELNGKYRFEATLSSQLGVLPSYTALGTASLLPHKTLAYRVLPNRGPMFWSMASRASPAGSMPTRWTPFSRR